MANPIQRMSFCLGDGVATIRRGGSSSVLVAGVLGVEDAVAGTTVYLDRKVHSPEQEWGEWTASGAISTILTKANR